jgi:hypothetical protein
LDADDAGVVGQLGVAAFERLTDSLEAVMPGNSKQEEALDVLTRRVAGLFSRILGTPDRPGPRLSLPASLQSRFVEAWLGKLREEVAGSEKGDDDAVRRTLVAVLIRVLHVGMRCEELWSERQDGLREAFEMLFNVYTVRSCFPKQEAGRTPTDAEGTDGASQECTQVRHDAPSGGHFVLSLGWSVR